VKICIKKKKIASEINTFHISYVESKNCIVERENAFFKSSPVDEYHLPHSEKSFFWCADKYPSSAAEILPRYMRLIQVGRM
jgi:hypothetical protein